MTGPTGPVFRSMSRRSERSRYISDNTINAALRTMGYDTKEQITGHGFRATARTMIREYPGWDSDVIERHLAHVSDEELGGSYDRTPLLVQCKTMVQQWADFLDELLLKTKQLLELSHLELYAQTRIGVEEDVEQHPVQQRFTPFWQKLSPEGSDLRGNQQPSLLPWPTAWAVRSL